MKRWHALAVVSIACGVGVLGSAGAVSAHADLESSSPSPSAILEAAPRDIVLAFSEPVSLIDRSVELFDQRQDIVDIPEPVLTLSDRVEVREIPPLEKGLYLVVWRVQSQDGHIAQGAFTFTIGSAQAAPGATEVTAEDLLAGVQRDGPQGLSLLRGVARAAAYLGLSAALGTLAFAAVGGLRRLRWVIGIGWSAAALGTVLQFMSQGVYISGGTWSDLLDAEVWHDVSSTRLGHGLVVRMATIAVLGVLIIVGSRVSALATTWWRSSTAVVGGGIVATFAATGHPSASSPAAVASAIDGVHLASVFIWIGGLLAVVFGERSKETVQAFSRVATVALPVAIVTGVWQAWHLVDDPANISATLWGRTLVVKTVLVVAVASMGMIARLVVRSDRNAPVGRLIVAEVLCAVAVIAATSTMVASSPRVSAAPAVMTATLAQDDIIANVTVTPGMVGANEIHVTVVTPGGALEPVAGLEIRMTQANSEIPPIEVAVDALGPNHYLGSVAIARSGTWGVELIVQVSASRIVRFSTDVQF